MAATVQRKLEFKVRKSSRIEARKTSSKQSKCHGSRESLDSDSENRYQRVDVKTVSPRKRSGKDNDLCEVSLNVRGLSCSPNKKKKELERLERETPIKTSLTCRFKPVNTFSVVNSVTDVSELNENSLKLMPTTPVKCQTTNINGFIITSLYKSPKRTVGFQRLLSSPVKSPVLSLKKLSLNSPQRRIDSPVKSYNNTVRNVKEEKTPVKNASALFRNASVTNDQNTPSRNVVTPCKNAVVVEDEETTSTKNVASPRRNVLSRKQEENTPVKNAPTPCRKAVSVLKLQRANSQAYIETKQRLHTAKPDRLDCREKEVQEIKSFLLGHLKNQTAGSMYISGAPGTGKTASLLHIIDNLKKEHACKLCYLNCMMLKDSTSVFKTLHEDLTGRRLPSNKDVVKYMEKCVTSSTKSLIIVLDEIDQLDSKNQEVLYTIFEWPFLQKSKLILVGVANALDFTDRILPRLQAKPKCRPKLVNYAPYSKDQIVTIINNRLKQLELDGLAVIEPSAVQFCARKISAVAGDMRKALDVCRRAVELVEHDIRCQQVLNVSDSNGSNQTKPPVPKKITVHHISRIMSEVYGSSVKSSSCQQEETIPLQQKLIMCCLLLLVKNGKKKEVGLGKFHETYCKICKKRQIAVVDQSEFFSLCSLLEARGMMGVKKGKETRLAKIVLKLDEKELEHTLQDKVLVSSMLLDGLPK